MLGAGLQKVSEPAAAVAVIWTSTPVRLTPSCLCPTAVIAMQMSALSAGGDAAEEPVLRNGNSLF